MSILKQLNSSEVDQFIEEGYVPLRQAFSPDAAAWYVDHVWDKLAIKRDDPSTWTSARAHLKENVPIPDDQPLYTPKVVNAIDDLLGESRWIPRTTTGWWPVTLPGFSQKPWHPPESGWHIDGIHFHHHLTSPEQGLLIIMIFSQVEPGDGGTAFRPGSHKVTAKLLAEAEPGGLTVGDLSKAVNAQTYPQELESTGMPGDLILMHPFMSHSASPNTGQRVRFITNNCIQLHKPMQLDRNPSELSPVEQAIINTVGRPGVQAS